MTSIRSGDWKLIRFYEDSRTELYYLANDLGEEQDVSETETAKTEELTAALDAYLAAIDAPLPTVNPDYKP